MTVSQCMATVQRNTDKIGQRWILLDTGSDVHVLAKSFLFVRAVFCVVTLIVMVSDER